MFKKVCFSLLLIISWSCFGQVTIVSGTATNIGPSAAIAPLISTPDIALSGSGSAVGAPLASAATNDSRFSRGPMVYNPNGTEYAVPTTNGSGVGDVSAQPKHAVAAQQFEFGIQGFEAGSTNTGAPPVSLGQIARNYRSQPHRLSRIYTNDSIAQMNAEAVTIGNLDTESAAVGSTVPDASGAALLQPASTATVVAENRAPALPQSDREAPPTAQSTIHMSPAAPDQNVPAPTIATAASTPATTTDPASSELSKLPQMGSLLPLLLLIGGAGMVSGVLHWWRR